MTERSRRRWGLAATAVVLTVLLGLAVSSCGMLALQGGSGWRLLATTNLAPEAPLGLGPHGEAAGSAEAVAALWTASGGSGTPDVDVAHEVLLRITVHGSSTCRPHLAGLGVRQGRLEVRTATGFNLGCTADAAPHSFLIAIRRELLPAPPFAVTVDAELAGSFEIEAIP
jgi:hypothetical protein